MQKNENRPGYKNTKVGWIPEGWDDSRLGEICSMKSGDTITSKLIHDEGEYRCFGGNGLRGFTKTFTHDGNFVLIGRQGALCGNVRFVSGKFYASEHAIVTTTFENINPSWLAESLGFKKLNRFSESSAQPGLSVSKVLRMRAPVPPLPEQEAIAGVLECWDRGIRTVENKIEKKRRIKKGLMQRLLSGKKRLPGFGNSLATKERKESKVPEGWKQVKLGDVASVNESSLGQNTEEDYEFYYVDLACVNNGTTLLPTKKIKFKNAPSRARRKFKKSDVLMATVRPNLLGHCYVDFDSVDKVCSTGFAVISERQGMLDNRFFYAHLFGEKLNTDIQNLLTGSNYPAINSSDVENLSFPLPPLKEQKAIAEVLGAADREIEALERKLDKWRDQKKYLLNNLVTGTIRLPEFRTTNSH